MGKYFARFATFLLFPTLALGAVSPRDKADLGGPLNAVVNGGCESSTAGYAGYDDGATTDPVNLTGGTATGFVLTASTSSPLAGTSSCLITKSGSTTRQGKGVSYAFSIPASDKNKIHTISFDYTVASGTFTAGTSSDLRVWVYDVTNSALIQPSTYTIDAQTGQYTATFQSTTSTSYRIALHEATTSASDFTFKFDNLKITAVDRPRGPPVTDWTAYTPIGGWTGSVTYTGYWRRVGDTAQIRAKVVVGGAITGTTLSFNLPTGVVIDTTKANLPGEDNTFGKAIVRDSAAGSYTVMNVIYASTTSVYISAGAVATHTGTVYPKDNSLVNTTNPISFGASDYVEATFEVPVAGWSSSLEVSSASDSRVVSARAARSGNQTGVNPNGTAVKIQLNSVQHDSHGTFDTVTNYRYTVPVPGYYRISGYIHMSGTNVLANTYYVSFYKNGSSYANVDNSVAVVSASTNRQGTLTLPLVAGDYIELYLFGAGNNSASTVTVDDAQLSIERLSGPSQIAASETIAARYYLAANTLFNAAVITFDTKVLDTHNAFAAGVFTAPAAGTYLLTETQQATTSSVVASSVVKNGSTVMGYVTQNNSTQIVSGSILVKLLSGETLAIKNDASLTYVGGVATSINILRVGNY